VLQGKGYRGGAGQPSCLKENFTVFRHYYHQEQAKGKVSQNIGQHRQHGVQLSLTASQLHVQKMAEGLAVEDTGKAPSV